MTHLLIAKLKLMTSLISTLANYSYVLPQTESHAFLDRLKLMIPVLLDKQTHDAYTFEFRQTKM